MSPSMLLQSLEKKCHGDPTSLLLLPTASGWESHVDLERVVDHPLEASQGTNHDNTANKSAHDEKEQ